MNIKFIISILIPMLSFGGCILVPVRYEVDRHEYAILLIDTNQMGTDFYKWRLDLLVDDCEFFRCSPFKRTRVYIDEERITKDCGAFDFDTINSIAQSTPDILFLYHRKMLSVVEGCDYAIRIPVNVQNIDVEGFATPFYKYDPLGFRFGTFGKAEGLSLKSGDIVRMVIPNAREVPPLDPRNFEREDIRIEVIEDQKDITSPKIRALIQELSES